MYDETFSILTNSYKLPWIKLLIKLSLKSLQSSYCGFHHAQRIIVICTSEMCYDTQWYMIQHLEKQMPLIRKIFVFEVDNLNITVHLFSIFVSKHMRKISHWQFAVCKSNNWYLKKKSMFVCKSMWSNPWITITTKLIYMGWKV